LQRVAVLGGAAKEELVGQLTAAIKMVAAVFVFLHSGVLSPPNGSGPRLAVAAPPAILLSEFVTSA
jgi:hypothetical protein